ncbi:alpha/beta hydrolase [Sporosarcina cyprini]|uniref:alpha/beta hydrolase n=1 Tax=Sporosarcina cyprini TaxID=2910523 RepID=UPI001EE0F076|nr:alpha/beta fold hydrolase [Sporosarcina cyprini]MCG3086734.1 alpha/beta fold hydrolase [Sporosarcina cyprini]
MKTGVLVIHGFTGGPFEVRPFIHYLKDHTDWNISVPTLPGHGLPPNLRGISAEAWMMEAELALKRLLKESDRVILAGFSMGGLIAMYLSLRYPVDKLVLLSAAAKYISPKVMLADIVKMLTESVTKKHSPNTFYHLYDYKLANTPLQSAVEFLRLNRMVVPYYHQITTPVCIVQGKKDEIVPFATGEHLYQSLGSTEKHLIISESGKHHICYSDDSADWFSEVLAFMQKDTGVF